MACSSCGRASGVMQVQRLVREQISREDCEYTQNTLEDYLSALKCIKDKNIFNNFNLTYAKLNSLIGIVKSAKNYSSNPCYFKASLDSMTTLINNINTSGQC